MKPAKLSLLQLFIHLIPLIGFSQQSTSILATPEVPLTGDSTSSYIYCATMEIMWDEFSHYLGETPKLLGSTRTIELLNQSISENYQRPIEEQFVVAKAGRISNEIIEAIDLELEQKFHTTWQPPAPQSNEALLAYAHLKKDVKFKSTLDEEFYEESFNNEVNVDYFGIKLGDPTRTRKDVFIHDFKDFDDFIVQIKCKDSLDEIYFAKIPSESTLSEMYESVMDRIKTGKTDYFTGNDILKIPFIDFDTTKRYQEFEDIQLDNELVGGLSFLSVRQKISFDLNSQGIKLESSVASIIDLADFDYELRPRVFVFNDPFLIIMKRKNSNQPYFLYWVANTDFMRSYITTTREIEVSETPFVGTWKFEKYALVNGVEHPFSDRQFITFRSNGTCSIVRSSGIQDGMWKFEDDEIRIKYVASRKSEKYDHIWKIAEISDEQFIVDDGSKLFFTNAN